MSKISSSFSHWNYLKYWNFSDIQTCKNKVWNIPSRERMPETVWSKINVNTPVCESEHWRKCMNQFGLARGHNEKRHKDGAASLCYGLIHISRWPFSCSSWNIEPVWTSDCRLSVDTAWYRLQTAAISMFMQLMRHFHLRAALASHGVVLLLFTLTDLICLEDKFHI